jgi:hypothetical protein
MSNGVTHPFSLSLIDRLHIWRDARITLLIEEHRLTACKVPSKMYYTQGSTVEHRNILPRKIFHKKCTVLEKNRTK